MIFLFSLPSASPTTEPVFELSDSDELESTEFLLRDSEELEESELEDELLEEEELWLLPLEAEFFCLI